MCLYMLYIMFFINLFISSWLSPIFNCLRKRYHQYRRFLHVAYVCVSLNGSGEHGIFLLMKFVNFDSLKELNTALDDLQSVVLICGTMGKV